MKIVLTITLLFLQLSLHAATHYWPDALDCPSTLNACVSSANDNDLIIIQTDTPIAESITTNKDISFRNHERYTPVFAEGHGITINIANSVEIKGLTFLRGFVSVTQNRTPTISAPQIIIKENIFKDVIHTSNNSAIKVVKEINGANPLEVIVRNNNIAMDNFYYRDGVVIENTTQSQLDVKIIDNSIYSESDFARGLSLITNDSNASANGAVTNVLAYSNKIGVNCNNCYGIYVNQDNTSYLTSIEIRTSNNFINSFTSNSVAINFNGSGFGGSIDHELINNTIIKGSTGLENQVNSTTLNHRILNNIITGQTINNIKIGGSNIVANGANIIYGPGNLGYSNDPSDIIGMTAPTNLLDQDSGRLRPGSQAIDAGNPFALFATGAPLLDADGMYRVKYGGNSTVVDIGAFEFGDKTLVVKANTTSSKLDFSLDFNENSSLDNLHLTLNRTGHGYETSANHKNEALDKSFLHPSLVSIKNQDGSFIQQNTSFNVVSFANSTNTFTTTNDVGSSSIAISNTSLNNDSSKIVLVTQQWNDDGGSSSNNHPIGVDYIVDKWGIFNLDEVNMPIGTLFNVYYQDQSKSAWKHTVSLENYGGFGSNYSVINNPLINGVSCAQIWVTQERTLVDNDNPVEVVYNSTDEKWRIRNKNIGGGDELPVGSVFHLLVNPQQIEECDVIFKNGLD